MRELVWIALGGAAGAVSRYLVTLGGQRWTENLPVATLIVKQPVSDHQLATFADRNLVLGLRQTAHTRCPRQIVDVKATRPKEEAQEGEHRIYPQLLPYPST